MTTDQFYYLLLVISSFVGFGVSIGICVASPPDANFETMYRGADHALYKAKTAGKNRYVIFQPIAATG